MPSNIAELNYYQILGVLKTATKVQICQAYKSLALQYHPSLKHQNINKTYKKFCLISEAFDILYDDEKRRVYDQYGQQKMKEGIVNDKGQRELGNYTFTTQPQAIFQKFFGSRNVFEHLLTVGDGEGRSHPIFSSQYNEEMNGDIPSTLASLVVQVQCTLSELFNGCQKTLTYSKNILTQDGQGVRAVKQTKTMDIPPGSSKKNPIKFKGQGNQYPGMHPSDLLFQIVEIPEMGFKRDESDPEDLIYTSEISLIDALESKSIQIKELNGEIIQLHFDQIISPQTQRNIPGKGMPIDGNLNNRGDLLVKFNIVFPQEISIEKKERIVELLSQSA